MRYIATLYFIHEIEGCYSPKSPTAMLVQPPLEFITPAFNPAVFWVTRMLLPLVRGWQTPVATIEISNGAVLAKLYQQFQNGNTRFMLAFRHPSTNDPFVLAYLLWDYVPRIARQEGINLTSVPHVHLLYDRGIPLWAGKGVGWLGSQLGGTPIRRGKVDLQGLRSARHLFAQGQFPLAAAPEGATNGHNEVVSPVEPGIAQFGFWCIEDLKKEGRSQPVVILPIGIQYFFIDAPWGAIATLLGRLELESGLVVAEDPTLLPRLSSKGGVPTPEQEKTLYQRLICLGDHLLSQMEEFYRKFYHQPIPKYDVISEAADQDSRNEQLGKRLQNLLNAALVVAEEFFNVPAKGTITDRCRRLEQAGWDWIYREDLKQLETLPPVERGLADRIAEESDLRLWHMRLVENFVSVTGRYVLEKPTVDRFAETLLLLGDTIACIKGQSPFPRPVLGKQRVQITIGKTIDVTDRYSDYQANRRQAIATLTQDIQTALVQMIQ